MNYTNMKTITFNELEVGKAYVAIYGDCTYLLLLRNKSGYADYINISSERYEGDGDFTNDYIFREATSEETVLIKRSIEAGKYKPEIVINNYELY